MSARINRFHENAQFAFGRVLAADDAEAQALPAAGLVAGPTFLEGDGEDGVGRRADVLRQWHIRRRVQRLTRLLQRRAARRRERRFLVVRVVRHGSRPVGADAPRLQPEGAHRLCDGPSDGRHLLQYLHLGVHLVLSSWRENCVIVLLIRIFFFFFLLLFVVAALIRQQRLGQGMT